MIDHRTYFINIPWWDPRIKYSHPHWYQQYNYFINQGILKKLLACLVVNVVSQPNVITMWQIIRWRYPVQTGDYLIANQPKNILPIVCFQWFCRPHLRAILLTHWPLRDMAIILDIWYSDKYYNSFLWQFRWNCLQVNTRDIASGKSSCFDLVPYSVTSDQRGYIVVMHAPQEEGICSICPMESACTVVF